MKPFKDFLPYPFILVSALTCSLILLGHTQSAPLSVMGGTFLSALLVLTFEKLSPENTQWKPLFQELKLDLFHALISNPIPNYLFKALFMTILIQLNQAVETSFNLGLWPHNLPLVFQAFFTLALAELAFYSLHRFFHNSRYWRLHALHHSVERMYFLAGSRTHPLQVFMTYGLQMAFLWLLGAPQWCLVFHAVFTSTNGLLQHANIRMRFGFLNYLLATPQLHRWHHSKIISESNNNYGTNLILWDILFGSFFLPQKQDYPRELGLLDGDQIPLKLKEQLLSPWSLKR